MIIYDKSKKLIDQLRRQNDHVDYWHYSKFIPIQLGNHFAISIQAGEYNYCSPRDYFEYASEYDNFEIALLKASSLEWTMIQPRNFFPEEKFDWVELFEKGDSAVAGWVSIQKIEKIVEDVLRLDPIMCFE